MPNVLIRDVPSDDLDQIRAAAAQRGTSVQGFLLEAVHAQAVHLRRQAAIARTAARLRGQAEIPVGERGAVLAAIDLAQQERAGQVRRHHRPARSAAVRHSLVWTGTSRNAPDATGR